MFLMDTRIKTQVTLRCGRCSKQTSAESDRCEFCDFEIRPAAPKTIVAKIKRALGIELSSEIVSINLEDDGRFFSAREIDSLLGLENLKVLELADVPDYDTMFYASKRIRKPINRNKS